jgi:hypothetical protein
MRTLETFIMEYILENVICTSGTQHGYNTPSHGGGPHTLRPTPM